MKESGRDGPATTFTATITAIVVDDELHDRTPSDLWPSDHAGVVARIMAVPQFR